MMFRMVKITIFWSTINILYYLMPETYRKIGIEFGRASQTDLVLKPDDYVDTICSWVGLCTRLKGVSYDLSKRAFYGEPAPNAKVISLDGKMKYQLLDFAKTGRPLVLNFGSCT